MNNWIKKHRVCYSTGTPIGEWAIPVSALEELFSKSGEQLARDYAVSMGFKLELVSGGDIMRSFIEAYNIQEVKIASSMLDIDSLLSEFKRQGFNVDNWDGEQGAEKAIVDGVSVVVSELKKERDAYYDELHAKRIEVERLKSVIQGYAPNITDPNACKQCGGEGGWYEDVAGDGLGSMWISCDECGEDDEPLNPQP
jgi:hypothetical protein